MLRQVFFRQFCGYSLLIAGIFLSCASSQASDLSERLWGGQGSRTTVTDPYVPPALVTEAASVPVAGSAALSTTQTQLMIGTPGAMTLPPGGVVALNGVASGPVTSGGIAGASYVPSGASMALSGVTPAFQFLPPPAAQPTVEYAWSYSTIKDVTYEPITVYDRRFGSYVTTYQEKQTESVLPWLHRKQVVRYQPPTVDPVNSPLAPARTSERAVVNRLFPVSAVPSPSAQPIPTQTILLQAAPMTIYASDAAPYTTLSPINPTSVTTTTFRPLPTQSTITQGAGELPIVTATTIAQPLETAATVNTPMTTGPVEAISSRRADEQPSLSGVMPPSAQQVLYPGTSTSSDVSSEIPPPSRNTTVEQTTSPLAANRTSTPRTGISPVSQPGTPTLAPPRSEVAGQSAMNPVEQSVTPPSASNSFRLTAERPMADTSHTSDSTIADTVSTLESHLTQPTRIQESLTNTTGTQAVELPPGATLPVPVQPSQSPPVRSQTAPLPRPAEQQEEQTEDTISTKGVYSLTVPTTGTTSASTSNSQKIQPPATHPTRASTGQPELNISPTRMSPLYK